MSIDPEHEHARLTGRVMDLKPPGTRLPAWSCLCARPTRQRHTEPAQCISQTEVEAWRWRHAEATLSDQTVRALLFIESFRR